MTKLLAAFKTSEYSACKLLAETELTLKKSFKVAQAVESADTQVQELQHPCMACNAVGPQFRSSRVQKPQGAPVDNRSLTHRELSFTHPLSLIFLTHVRALFNPSHYTAP